MIYFILLILTLLLWTKERIVLVQSYIMHLINIFICCIVGAVTTFFVKFFNARLAVQKLYDAGLVSIPSPILLPLV